MTDHQRPWHEDKAMRVTCYLLAVLAITISIIAQTVGVHCHDHADVNKNGPDS